MCGVFNGTLFLSAIRVHNMAMLDASGVQMSIIPQAFLEVSEFLQCSPFEEKYTIQDTIGQGCFATVHRCQSKETGQQYAVKVQQLDTLSPRHLECLKHEILTQQGVDHIGVVKLLDVLIWDGNIYLVQELMEGGDTAELLLSQGQLSADDVVRLLRSVLSAVCALHDNGIVHRDLKPANVLLPDKGTCACVAYRKSPVVLAFVASTVCMQGTRWMRMPVFACLLFVFMSMCVCRLKCFREHSHMIVP